MSEWNAGYYGSGLRLNEEEFIRFFERYLALNPKEPKMAMEQFVSVATYDPEEAFELTAEAVQDCGYIPSNLAGTEIAMDPESEKRFGIVRIQNDDIYDGMRFMPYRVNGKFNVPYITAGEEKSENPEFVNWIDLRSETSYMVFSDRDLDGPMSFVRKPYDSYEDLVDEFRLKMGQYLPEDFDWDAHIGRFTYSACC